MVSSLEERKVPIERVPKGAKNAVHKALDALIIDRAITTNDKSEIVELINYRNVISHEMHNLMADLSPDRMARDMVIFVPEMLKKYDYKAVERLQHFRRLLNGLYRTHHYASTLNTNELLFKSAEKTFLSEIKRLNLKIEKLAKKRQEEIKALNIEISLKGTELEGDQHPSHPFNQYENDRLTKRGIEICYRLFDMGKSPMAVAHLFGISLIAARKQQRTWQAIGGLDRKKDDIATIPLRKFYARHDD